MRTVALTFAVSMILAGPGCQSLGITPPSNQLLPETKAIRESAPPTPAIPRELAKSLQGPYVVEPGDTLSVQPVAIDSPLRLPSDQTIFADGTIDLGSYGRPVVAGKTLAEIEPEINKLISARDKAKGPNAVTVRLVARNSKVYYVLGEVNAPGMFPVVGSETVLDAIVKAGGVTKRAGEQDIVLSRPTEPDGCRVVYPVCYTNIVQLGDTTTNYQIQPGDRIYVPGRGLLEGIFQGRRCKSGVCKKPQVGCWGMGGGAGGCSTCPGGMPGMTPLPTIPTVSSLPTIPTIPGL